MDQGQERARPGEGNASVGARECEVASSSGRLTNTRRPADRRRALTRRRNALSPPVQRSQEGVRQAESVREFIKNNKAKPGDAGRHAAILNHESDKASLLVASNLRRCISTCLIGERAAGRGPRRPRAAPGRPWTLAPFASG